MAKVIGIVFFLAGCAGLYWVGQRAFKRRNQAGIEEFNSFGGALAVNAIEGVVKIASWAGIALGFVMFVASLMVGH